MPSQEAEWDGQERADDPQANSPSSPASPASPAPATEASAHQHQDHMQNAEQKQQQELVLSNSVESKEGSSNQSGSMPDCGHPSAICPPTSASPPPPHSASPTPTNTADLPTLSHMLCDSDTTSGSVHEQQPELACPSRSTPANQADSASSPPPPPAAAPTITVSLTAEHSPSARTTTFSNADVDMRPSDTSPPPLLPLSPPDTEYDSGYVFSPPAFPSMSRFPSDCSELTAMRLSSPTDIETGSDTRDISGRAPPMHSPIGTQSMVDLDDSNESHHPALTSASPLQHLHSGASESAFSHASSCAATSTAASSSSSAPCSSSTAGSCSSPVLAVPSPIRHSHWQDLLQQYTLDAQEFDQERNSKKRSGMHDGPSRLSFSSPKRARVGSPPPLHVPEFIDSDPLSSAVPPHHPHGSDDDAHAQQQSDADGPAMDMSFLLDVPSSHAQQQPSPVEEEEYRLMDDDDSWSWGSHHAIERIEEWDEDEEAERMMNEESDDDLTDIWLNHAYGSGNGTNGSSSNGGTYRTPIRPLSLHQVAEREEAQELTQIDSWLEKMRTGAHFAPQPVEWIPYKPDTMGGRRRIKRYIQERRTALLGRLKAERECESESKEDGKQQRLQFQLDRNMHCFFYKTEETDRLLADPEEQEPAVLPARLGDGATRGKWRKSPHRSILKRNNNRASMQTVDATTGMQIDLSAATEGQVALKQSTQPTEDDKQSDADTDSPDPTSTTAAAAASAANPTDSTSPTAVTGAECASALTDSDSSSASSSSDTESDSESSTAPHLPLPTSGQSPSSSPPPPLPSVSPVLPPALADAAASDTDTDTDTDSDSSLSPSPRPPASHSPVAASSALTLSDRGVPILPPLFVVPPPSTGSPTITPHELSASTDTSTAEPDIEQVDDTLTALAPQLEAAAEQCPATTPLDVTSPPRTLDAASMDNMASHSPMHAHDEVGTLRTTPQAYAVSRCDAQ